MSEPVLLLAGPTGVGKSAVAMELAARWGAEIVSADARQLYRGLDIGTAKPTAEDRQLVPHHLLDLLDPSERYSAARFLADAQTALCGIQERGRRAIVVGGTGLYLKALREGLFEAPETSPEVREQVDEMYARDGKAGLAEYLRQADPATLAALDVSNPARLRRAVEYHLMTAESLHAARSARPGSDSPFTFYPVILSRPRAELYSRIEDRIARMLSLGWLEEVRTLSDSWDFGLPAFDAVGYRELYDVVLKRVTFDSAVAEIVRKTRRYAKRQMTWFSHQGAWIPVSLENDVTSKISSGLEVFAENKSA